MKEKNIFLFLYLLFLVGACGEEKDRSVLHQAENRVIQPPASAVAMFDIDKGFDKPSRTSSPHLSEMNANSDEGLPHNYREKYNALAQKNRQNII